jgi:hypothetical protein
MMARSLAETGYIRFAPRDEAQDAVRREWLHFIVRAPGCEVIVNLSLGRSPSGGLVGAVLLLVRAGEDRRWDGDLDTYDVHANDVGTGRLRLRVGGATVDYEDGFTVRARCRRRAVSVDLSLTPECHPYLVPNISLGEGGAVHWLVAPRLRASGTVQLGERTLSLSDAVAYHDHNWGRFGGADLQWEWGCTLADETPDGPAPSVVVVRVLDRNRARVAAQGMVVWEGARRRQMFRGAELTMGTEGWLRAPTGLRVPRALSLLAPGPPTGVPARVRLAAEAGGDRLEGEFRAEDVARVLVPRETDLRTTVIHEVLGRMSLAGMCGGAALAVDAPALFEFLGEAS